MLLPVSVPIHVRVPPIKTQGIKTKIVPLITSSIQWNGTGRWIEPFLGSGTVAFNVNPEHALLSDTNVHIITFYKAIQSAEITPSGVRQHLEREGKILRNEGETHYYHIRKRFNQQGDPLDFLFLNRACFNGVMRWNSKGNYNVPFCRKPERFSQAYISKIANQVAWVQTVLADRDWVFKVADWRDTLAEVTPDDFLYLDPPYVARHADYFGIWSDNDANDLAKYLQTTTSGFAYSMWLENKYRKNDHLQTWFAHFPMTTFDHFYHVGATETLRNPMIEALIVSPANFVAPEAKTAPDICSVIPA